MEWFRWHHGLCTDMKWPLIAKMVGQPVCVVVAIWAAVLEHASQQEDRGSVEGLDPDAIDCFFGCNGGVTLVTLEAFHQKNLIKNGRITDWEKRQTKRADATSNERVRRFREKKSSVDTNTSEIGNAGCNADVTACNDVKRKETPDRLEKNKEYVLSSGDDPIPFSEIISLYHEVLPELTRVRVLTKRRKGFVRSRWLEDAKRQDLGWWREFFGLVRKQPHLMGANDRNWRADFEWLMAPTGFSKTYEGKFLPREKPPLDGIPTISLTDEQVEAMCKPKVIPGRNTLGVALPLEVTGLAPKSHVPPGGVSLDIQKDVGLDLSQGESGAHV